MSKKNNHIDDAFNYFIRSGQNCRCSLYELVDIPGITTGKNESEKDFQKRIYNSYSDLQLKVELAGMLTFENYEMACIIRDIMNERKAKLA